MGPLDLAERPFPWCRGSPGFILTPYPMLGFVVIVAKMSDIFGRKPVYVLSILMFTIFSGGCAAAKTMPQL